MSENPNRALGFLTPRRVDITAADAADVTSGAVPESAFSVKGRGLVEVWGLHPGASDTMSVRVVFYDPVEGGPDTPINATESKAIDAETTGPARIGTSGKSYLSRPQIFINPGYEKAAIFVAAASSTGSDIYASTVE